MAKQPPKPAPKSNKKLPLFLAAAFIFILGILVGKFFLPRSQKTDNSAQANTNNFIEKRQGGYQFINPLLDCDNYQAAQSAPIALMESSARAYISQTISSGDATAVSVYFRDLNNGPWMGINETEDYAPASLLKVPIMIAVLKKEETTPGILQKKILYEHPADAYGQNIVDTGMIVPGHQYTVEDLLSRMITSSDNEAKDLLFQLVGDEAFMKVISDMGLIIPNTSIEDYMSVKDYSAFFRILYNATYLNKDMSEKGLTLLSKARFTKGIVAGIPAGVVVAHKFGERGYPNTSTKQLHDCGIVYAGNRPYLVCLMTRGNDFDKQAKVIADISNLIWKQVNGQ